jgi:hypothetical protein
MSLALTMLVFAAAPLAAAGPQLNFRSPLTGDEEVPAVDSQTVGVATYKLSADETEMAFKLIVANGEQVTQAHIHCGLPGTNGPIVVFLYGFGPTVDINGVLSSGVITAANVIARPDSAACPGGVANFDDLIAKLRTGGAYTNVHTVAHPGGETRGFIFCDNPNRP